MHFIKEVISSDLSASSSIPETPAAQTTSELCKITESYETLVTVL